MEAEVGSRLDVESDEYGTDGRAEEVRLGRGKGHERLEEKGMATLYRGEDDRRGRQRKMGSNRWRERAQLGCAWESSRFLLWLVGGKNGRAEWELQLVAGPCRGTKWNEWP
ncbi:hypothetical protein ACFE04_020925 [Oxalis oulophora]